MLSEGWESDQRNTVGSSCWPPSFLETASYGCKSCLWGLGSSCSSAGSIVPTHGGPHGYLLVGNVVHFVAYETVVEDNPLWTVL